MNNRLSLVLGLLGVSAAACSPQSMISSSKGPVSLSNAVAVSQPSSASDSTIPETLLAIPDELYHGKARVDNLGKKKFAHVMIQSPDSRFAPGYKAEMQNVMRAIEQYYYLSSYGQLDAQIDTLGIYEISYDFTSDVGCFCTNGSEKNKMGIAQLQDKVHVEMWKQGIDLSQYDYVAYHFSEDKRHRCAGGNGVMNGNVSILFDTPETPEYLSRGIVPLRDLSDAFIHEWGHNMGMAHNNNNGGNFVDGRNVYNGWRLMGLIQAKWNDHGLGQPLNVNNLISAGWLSAHSIANDAALPAEGRVYRIYSLSKMTALGARDIVLPVEGSTLEFHLSYPTSEAGTFYQNIDQLSAQQNLVTNDALNITVVDSAGWSNAGCTHLSSDNSFVMGLSADGQKAKIRDFGYEVERLNTVDNGSEKYVEVLVKSVARTTADTTPPDVEIKTPIAGGHHGASYTANSIDIHGANPIVEVKVAAADENEVSAVVLVVMPFLQNSRFVGTQIHRTSDGLYTFEIDDSEFCDPNADCAYTVKALASDLSGNQSQGDLISVIRRR